ncbi:ankyrin repeat domain-containing protein [Holophaga foetida]|uniref:ankyrin repeat domain-containing protein n=1 Tax=Holophaga foetida TaxID=35839 RepID=UPI0002472638|nr:ankyrin repeat domain-containing protein [Holophaga foetida]
MRRNKCFQRLVLLFLMCCTSLALDAKGDGPKPELYQAISRDDTARAKAAIASGADVNAIYDRDTMLLWALRNKREGIAKLLLQSPRLDVNKRGVLYDDFSDWERTPLIQSAHMGQAEIVGLLLQRGAKVNARDRVDNAPELQGNTALIKAAQRNHDKAIEVLLTQGKGIEVDAQTKDGLTPLWFIAEWGNLASLNLLYKHGAKINITNNFGQSVLITTALHKEYNVLDYLVANGANINQVDQGGHTPLMTLIPQMGPNGKHREAGVRFMEKFITFKPQLDLQKLMPKGGGYSALHLAARFGAVDAIRLLLDNGATIDLKSVAMGDTPLHATAIAHQIDAAKLLIQRKAKVDIFDKSGATPLIVAVYQADEEMVKVLIDGGAAINTKSPVNVLVTPLVYAASNPDPFKHRKNLAIMETLLSRNGNVNFQSANGRTALMAAAQQSDTSQGYERAALLISKGAKLDMVNDRGETALMLAAGAGNAKLVALLTKKGADIKKKNGAGETVMSYANRSNNKSSLSTLSERGAVPDGPIVRKQVTVGTLLGTWQGYQEGMPQVVWKYVFKKDNTFEFVSQLTPAVLKTMPAGSVKPVIAAFKGKYTVNNDLIIFDPSDRPPVSQKWRMEKESLVIDEKIHLKKK